MSATSGGVTQFIQELRNRRVFRVAAVYLGAAFALLEAADIVVATYGLPDSVIRILMILLLVGFPLSTGLAWSFQFTPEGLRRSPKTGEKQTASEKPLTSNGIIISLLLVIAVLLAFPRYRDAPSVQDQVTIEALLDTKSIAVLPFTPFTDEREDEIFADGMHDDILTQLSKIGDLKVISRTSVMQYKGTSKLIPDIAQELGVTNILEGSVRRAGDQIRVVAQLINAKTDEHLWAETFDRKYADIFSIQTEVAKKIASAMKATLTPAEVSSIEQQPTENLEAYNYYMRGKLSFESYSGQTTKLHLVEQAIEMYEKSVSLDPGLLVANTALVEAYVQQLNSRVGIAEQNIEKANYYLQRAKTVDANGADTYKAMGLVAYYVDRDYEKALDHFEHALKGKPNDADVIAYMAAVVRRQGNFEQSQKYYQRAVEINPRSGSLLYNASTTSMYMHLWQEEAMYIDLLIALEPESVWWEGSKAWNIFQQTGDPNAGLEYLYAIDHPDNKMENFESFYWLLWYNRDKEKLRDLLDANDPSSWYLLDLYYGFVERLLGNEEQALTHYRKLEKTMLERLDRTPDHPREMGYLAYAYLGQGKKEAAIKLATRATEIIPVEMDAMEGTRTLLMLCDIYALAKDKENTLKLLERLMHLPSETSVYDSKYDPNFDFLRGEPRFKEVLKHREDIYQAFK